MRFGSLSILSGVVATKALAYALSGFQDNCMNLAHKIQLDYPFTVNIAQYYPPQAAIEATQNATCGPYQHVPVDVGICRFNLKVATTNSSETYVEVWIPDNWTGRVLTVGNGGLAGCIGYPTISYGASQGFAAVGTNAGHNGTSGGAFLNQPEVLEDFSWRSVYVGTIVGKSIAKQLYQKDLGKVYYVGCSAGGRQGWKAVQKTPDIFDGVVAGAPAFDFYAHLTIFGYVYPNKTFISLQQWADVGAAVLRQCDGLDGAYDGIVEDPRACKFDWSAVSCATNSTSLCLTPDQVTAASKLFAPISYNGTVLHPTGQYNGYELTLITSILLDFVTNWIPEVFRYLVYSDPSWDPTTFTMEDMYHAIKANVGDLSTFDPDISAFRQRGGKVLHWHGTADSLLSFGISDVYYASVQKHFNATTAELDEFYRYFRPGGVGHCYSGPGANVFGQDGEHISGLGADDNLITRIVEWVEEGKAPEFLRGTKYVNDVIGGEVAFRRKHCKVPLVNVYKGTKNGTDEEGWECVEK